MTDPSLVASPSLEAFDANEVKEIEEALANTKVDEPVSTDLSSSEVTDNAEANAINWAPIGGKAEWAKDGMTLTATYESPTITQAAMWDAFTPWNAPKWQVRIKEMRPIAETWKGSMYHRGTKLAFIGAGLSGPFASIMTVAEFNEEEDFLHSRSEADLPGSSKMSWQLTVTPFDAEKGTGSIATTVVTFKLSRPMRLLWPIVRKRFTKDTAVFRKALNRYLEAGITSEYSEVDDAPKSGILAKIAQKIMKSPTLPEMVDWDEAVVKSTLPQRLSGDIEAAPTRSDLLCMGAQLVASGREGDKAPLMGAK